MNQSSCYNPVTNFFLMGLRILREYPDGYHPCALDVDLAGVNIETECEDVNTVAIQYDDWIRELLDEHL